MTAGHQYELDDRFRSELGRVYLSGIDALVRLPLEQARRDRLQGQSTAGFVSGYRGSPLGNLDLALWRAQRFLAAEGITFQPGVNEDLAATAVWGTQQVALMPESRVQGVFGLWYGKGPGVDRSTDALKHGNFAGSSAVGGVVVVVGDDPGAKSSSLAHQSEQALVHCGIPVLSPSTVEDLIEFGLFAWEMSRFAGCWVGLRCVTDVVESAGTVEVGAVPAHWARPEDVWGERHIQWNRSAPEMEQRRATRAAAC
ncbi:MAG: hypothetical protein QM733_15035 [Ilumatobacteraceae bacterium]